MSRGHILVVGAGIGGLATAVALRQAGFEVTVAERSDSARASVFGVGIIQPLNALRALDMIGCAEACVEAGYPATAWGSMYAADGSFIKDMPGTPIEGLDLPPMNGITRPRLHDILTRRAVEVGAEIRYSFTFSELEPDETGVDVTFVDGTRARFDVVVGADGAMSSVRQHVLENDVELSYLGQSAYRANIPMLAGIDRIVLQAHPSGMAGMVPIGPDEAYIFFNAAIDRPDPSADPEQVLADFKKCLEPFGGIAGEIRDHHLEDPAAVVLRPEETIGVPTRWHQGRIVLIGDAVHTVAPHLGQGAAQAIEDGIVLAEVLARHDDVETAFGEYFERRYERCRLVVETCIAIGEWEMGLRPGFDNVAATEHVLEVMARPL